MHIIGLYAQMYTHLFLCLCVGGWYVCVYVCKGERERERWNVVIVSYYNPIINLKFTSYHYLRI